MIRKLYGYLKALDLPSYSALFLGFYFFAICRFGISVATQLSFALVFWVCSRI
jgi:hypothetical protein